MIKETIIYTTVCNKCGKVHGEDSEYCGWNDKAYALEQAIDDNWVVFDDVHYCPDCYKYNEVTNEYIVEE